MLEFSEIYFEKTINIFNNWWPHGKWYFSYIFHMKSPFHSWQSPLFMQNFFKKEQNDRFTITWLGMCEESFLFMFNDEIINSNDAFSRMTRHFKILAFVPLSKTINAWLQEQRKVEHDGLSVDVKINSFHSSVKPWHQMTHNAFEDTLTVSMNWFYIFPFPSVIQSF